MNYVKKRRGLLSNSKSVDANTKQEDELENDHDFDRYSSVDEIKDLNAPEKIIINTQVEEEVDEPEDFKSNRSKPEKKIHQTASKDNIFQEFLEFIIKSLKAPSLKTTSNDFLMGIISLVIEFIFFAFSLQLLYNSGFQMSAKGNDKAFGQYLIHALDPNNKHNILGLMLVLFLVFLLIPLLGIFCDKFLIRDRDFSIKSFIAQFSRYSISLLPISVLAFVYSLFNNPFVTKLTLILLCLAPVILILASSLYLLQARGQVLFDRVYIISLYFAVSMIVSYLLVHPYFISFAKSFTTFLG
ncbi:hypothetical protein [Xylocopilactobacillus apis]|nr:hypothetical protein [Xylocopilactobacillus apis]